MLGLPALVEVLDGPAGVPSLIERHHPEAFIDRDRPP